MRPLWDHQTQALDALRQTIGQGIKRIVLQAPTGAGKTILGAVIIDGALNKDKKVAFVAPAISLIDQTLEVLVKEGVPEEYIGVIQADHIKTDWSRPIQVCSIDTIRRRIFPEADVVIFDEVHELHEAHKKWLVEPRFKDVPFIGLSATPYTRGLGKHFQTKITVATTQQLIDKGILSPFRAFATGHPDLRGVKTVGGDFNQRQLSDAMQSGTLTADIIRTWEKEWGRGKGKTFCFAVDCAHAQQLQKRFNEAGIAAGYQDAHTPLFERKRLKEQFHNGQIEVLTNVGTLTTGVDYDVRCLILARPTKSESLYQQIIGRALRAAEGKEYALILDHSDTTANLGFITDVEARHPTLDDGEPKLKKPQLAPEKLPKSCPKCGMLRIKGKKCIGCGFEVEIISDRIERDGQLQEITRDGMLVAPKKSSGKELWTLDQKDIFMAELKAFAMEQGRKVAWASHAYKKKFNEWPRLYADQIIPAKEVGTYTRSYCKSLDIAYFNSQAYRDKQNAKTLTKGTQGKVVGTSLPGRLERGEAT